LVDEGLHDINKCESVVDMCGIAGMLLQNEAALPDRACLNAMIQMLKHRGPDCQQAWVGTGVGLAHARLSIIDLESRSNQPLEDDETDSILVFNGEIYNYIELRRELQTLGYSFVTESDTEIIPKAYHAWGTDCLSRFNGMWAFALYDQKRQELFCARDRYGIKPFCYATTHSGDFVFASEHKAIWTHFPEFAQPNPYFLSRFLNDGLYPFSYMETFYDNIFHLLPSHYIITTHGGPIQQKSYYKIRQQFQNPLPSPEEATDHYTELLKDAIRVRYRSDVPVGSCMSGGLDSSTLVGLSNRLFEKPVQTFSCVHPQYPSVDESQYINENIQHFDCIPHFTTPDFDDFIKMIREATWEQDGPTGGPLILSQRAVMKSAQSKVRVLIDGQGADEVLGGYHMYFPYKLRTLTRDIARSPSLTKWIKLIIEKKRQEKRTGRKSKENILGLIKQTLHGKTVQFDLVNKEFSSTLDQQTPYPHDDLSSIMLEHIRIRIVDLLHCEDRNSMAFSIETRLPYLDYRLVDYSFSLPHMYKINMAKTKVLLHKIAKEVLPAKVYRRKDKMGFSTPGTFWFQRKESIAYLTSLFQNSGHHVFNYFSKKKFQSIKKAHARLEAGAAISHGQANDLWKLVTTVVWLEMLGGKYKSVDLTCDHTLF
jgi:asparagine synthase (glutamine-hydrolysing)